MPIQVNYVDSFQTRVAQSFVNLTAINSTKYPAVTTVQIYPDPSTGLTNALTSYNVYAQNAFRTIAVSGVPTP